MSAKIMLNSTTKLITGRIGTGQGMNTRIGSAFTVRFKYFFFATLFGGSFLILSFSSITQNVILSRGFFYAPSDSYNGSKPEGRYTIDTEGCSIPALKPFDKSIINFVEYPKTMDPCHDANISLLGNDQMHIWVKKENIQHYNITNNSHLSCCYKPFYRPVAIQDVRSSRVDDRVKYDDCTYFTDKIKVSHEFVRVTCSVGENKLYDQFYLFAPKKKYISHDGTTEAPQSKSAYNVIIMGIDAVSRLNFHRTMPKTINYMKSKGAVELVGYNKVGDNTFPNLIPMLLGIRDTELKKTCLPYGSATFDNCPFIWEWFKQAGYYTALGEDSSWLGTFNYVKVGFINTPTDYYIHTFMNEAEKNAGYNKDFNSYLCMNDKHFYKVLLEYIENLTVTLKSSKLFGFFWEVTMSHDHLNYPMVMDNDYVDFFKKLEASNYLNDTIVFLVSDHGIRWGDIRSTKQGRLEERLPFVFILTPQSFQETYSVAYNNMKVNGRRLTTPFDMHATLSDLLDLNTITNDALSSRSHQSYSRERGISLFLPIPTNRTCAHADIDDHWCTCHKGTTLPKDSVEALEPATHLIRYLNTLLRDYSQCARLKLASVIDVTKMSAGASEENEVGWDEMTVVVRAEPGGGVFEATLRRDNSEWTVSGTVSRLNLYGEQSRCMHNYQLKLYCYCI